MTKKEQFLSLILSFALLFLPAFALAASSEGEDAVDQTSAVLEPEESASSEEIEKASATEFGEKEEPFFEDEAEIFPIATVSGGEKEASVQDHSETPSEKKPAQSEANTGSSAALNTAAMEKRWKSIFSKEIGPDSKLYTVKSGDSLYVIARKHHTTVDLIKKINGLKSDDIYPNMKLKIHTESFSIEVDKSKNILVLYSGRIPVKKYLVATGKKNCTPVGKFKIKDKLVNPTWFKTGAILPPGSPENALGTRWMGFDKPAYGIHGTIEPKSIGTQASEGCIRMLNEEVEELYGMVPEGTSVTIQD